MMNAVGGGSFTRCAECCSIVRRDVRRVMHTSRSWSESRRPERVYLERNLFLEAPKLVSNARHALKGSKNARCFIYVTKRDVTQVMKCEVQKVKVRFRLNHQVEFGEHLVLLGSTECAGSWENRVLMEWTETGWVVDVEADPGETIEYKYIVITRDGNVVWEHGTNRVLVVPDDFSNYYQIVSHWSTTSEAIDFEVIDGSQAAEDGATEAEQGLLDETGDLEVIDGTQSPVEGAMQPEKEVTIEAIDSRSIERNHIPEAKVVEAREVEQEGDANGSSNLETIESHNTTRTYDASKPIVESDPSSTEWGGKMSVFILLLITCALVGLFTVSPVEIRGLGLDVRNWTFLSGFPSTNVPTEEGS